MADNDGPATFKGGGSEDPDNFRGGEPINVAAMYVPKIGKGLVRLQQGVLRPSFLAPNQARNLALQIMSCAQSAEADELLVKWLEQSLGWDDPRKQVAVLEKFAQMRIEALLRADGPGEDA